MKTYEASDGRQIAVSRMVDAGGWRLTWRRQVDESLIIEPHNWLEGIPKPRGRYGAVEHLFLNGQQWNSKQCSAGHLHPHRRPPTSFSFTTTTTTFSSTHTTISASSRRLPPWLPPGPSPARRCPPSPNPAPRAMFPVPPPYAWDHHLDLFDVVPGTLDCKEVALAAARDLPSHRQQRAATSEDAYYAAASGTAALGFVAMESSPPPAMLRLGELCHRGDVARGEWPRRLFCAGGTMAAGPDEAFLGSVNVAESHWNWMTCGNGFYGPQQEVYPATAYSAGDPLQVISGGSQHPVAGSSRRSPSLPMEDSSFKVCRLSPEERKVKIHRYMKKRNKRNFNKKIKYACRKTLADSRPRVRGRFAKNDDDGEAMKPTSSSHDFDDEEEVVMVKEEDVLDSDILAYISGVNSFAYNFTLESWI
ncbi:hypothetical protein Cni_G08885 [Canna indica]|uniref:CCT domain-containing protein n=1 Tax=Canna indica TaxID=4628 RepID=A0AAQ3K1A8_9LILI|nr:hypothetical protein Cni_G08885 [Canna indica]